MGLNLVLLVAGLIVLAGTTLALHWISRRYGLAPLLIYLTGVVTALHALAPLPIFTDVGGYSVLLSDVLLIPTILLTILILYEVDGTAIARVSIVSILGVSVVVLALQWLRGLQVALPEGRAPLGLSPDSPVFSRSWLTTAASILAFAASLSAIAVIHQAVRNWLPRGAAVLAPGLALMGALLLDDIVFRMIALGIDSYFARLSRLAGRATAAVLLWPAAALYLAAARRRFADHADEGRRTLDLLFGSYGRGPRALREIDARRRHAEERFRTVVSHTPVVIFGIDAAGRFTLSEGAGLRALGLEPGQVVGQSAFDLFPEVEAELRRALAGEGFTATVEVGEHTFETRYMPTVEDGRVTGLIGVAIDISQRRQVERALEEVEVRFQSTFEQAGVGLLHAEPSGEITLANRALRHMLGREPGGAVRGPFVELLVEEDRPAVVAGLAALLERPDAPFETEARYRHLDGPPVWGRTTASAVLGDEGAVRYLIIVVEDLTERRATEEQLRQAQKMEAVGQLTGGVAHDFNNLLTVVIGGIEIAFDEAPEGGESRGVLLDALRSAEKGAQLTRQLLAFSRRQPLQPTPIEVSELLHEMQKLLRPTLGETIEVVVDASPDTGSCVADRAQMESAILNLALNARDAMPKGGRLVLMSRPLEIGGQRAAAAGLEAGTYVEVAVADSGGGMDPEHLERAFDPFFTTKEVGRGSGLGLSMVYGFVTQSGGSIRLDNRPGEGLTVRFVLPATDGGATAVAVPDAATTDTAGRGRIVLLVEDDPGVRAVTTRILEQLGYLVVSSASAAPALGVLRERDDVALLLTDLVLPGGMTGYDLAAEARLLRPTLPVVLTSGYTGENLPEGALLQEELPFLEKPFQRGELAAVLARALEGAGAPPRKG